MKDKFILKVQGGDPIEHDSYYDALDMVTNAQPVGSWTIMYKGRLVASGKGFKEFK